MTSTTSTSHSPATVHPQASNAFSPFTLAGTRVYLYNHYDSASDTLTLVLSSKTNSYSATIANLTHRQPKNLRRSTHTTANGGSTHTADNNDYVSTILRALQQQDESEAQFEYALVDHRTGDTLSDKPSFDTITLLDLSVYQKIGIMPFCILTINLQSIHHAVRITGYSDTLSSIHRWHTTLQADIRSKQSSKKQLQEQIALLQKLQGSSVCNLTIVKTELLTSFLPVINRYKQRIRQLRQERDTLIEKRDALQERDEEAEDDVDGGSDIDADSVRDESMTPPHDEITDDPNARAQAGDSTNGVQQPVVHDVIDMAALDDDSQAYVIDDTVTAEVSAAKDVVVAAPELISAQPLTGKPADKRQLAPVPDLDDVLDFDPPTTAKARPNVRKRARVATTIKNTPAAPVEVTEPVTTPSATAAETAYSSKPVRSSSRRTSARGRTKDIFEEM